MKWWRKHEVPNEQREAARRAEVLAEARLKEAKDQRREAEKLARELRDVRRANRFAPMIVEALRGK